MRRLYTALFLITLSIFGCMQVTVDLTANNISVPVSMNNQETRPYKVVAHFKMDQEDKALFLPRLLGIGQPDISAMIKRQLEKVKGDAIINLKIQGESRVGDLLLPMIVGIGGMFIHPVFAFFVAEPLFTDLKRFSIEGDVVQYTDLLQKKSPSVKINPMTGLPINEKPLPEFDPETGLPKQ